MAGVGARFAVILLGVGSMPIWAAEDPNPPTLTSEGGAWPIRRQWTVPETHHFARWIQHIYRMKCEGTPEQRRAKIERVLTDPEMNLLLDPDFAGEGANPQLPPELMFEMHRRLDCGKLTVALSSYYAYRRALPWMISIVRSCDGSDLRSAPYNIPVGELNSFTAPSLEAFFVPAIQYFCTGNYRVSPYGPNAEQSDTVPVAIDPEHLIPGAMHYLDGHVLILADIDRHGELRFLDATTATSRDIYTFNGLNAVMGIPPRRSGEAGKEYAACLQGLKIFRYPIAETDETGKVIRVRRRTNEEMKAFGFSTEQYDKIEEMVTQQRIQEEDLALESFHELIQWRMRTSDRVHPIEFINGYADQLVELFTMREQFVQEAWADVQQNGPIPFPENSRDENVFTANGRWGQWSSAGLDVDIRNRYYYLAEWIDNAIRWFNRKPDFVNLEGLEYYYLGDRGNLARAIVAEKERIFGRRSFTYTNSIGEPVRLTLQDLESRLYDLSFDPNHPPELRWGARPGSPEARSSRKSDTPLPNGTIVPMEEAYRREAYYRAIGERETTESYLAGMFTDGFPTRPKFNEHMAKWIVSAEPVPPLVPHGWKTAKDDIGFPAWGNIEWRQATAGSR